MNRKSARRSSSSSMIETLESRTFLSSGGIAPVVVPDASGQSAIVAAAKAKTPSPVTKTTLKVQAGTLGQAITFTATVRDTAALGSPTGTVDIIDHGSVIQTLTVAPSSTGTKYDFSTASFTIPAGAGGQAYYFGSHKVSAVYSSTNSLKASTGRASFTVKTPKYTTQQDGLKIATVAVGSGPAIQAGQTATMMYTGYLTKNGSIFDDSSAHSPGTFSFTVAASPEQVITGFDEGTLGMQVGETRVLQIPAKLGYGSQGSAPAIPPNAKLIFLVTLVAIS
jgi:FKBP-type peptidyl-prolyl cis-trans isomerase FkpA